MKLNTKTRYGIRTMIELAMNWHTGTGLFQKDISERQSISYKYLDHIISALKTKGLIVNIDGKKSGYRMAESPEKTTVYDVYKSFEPELKIVDCVSSGGECKNQRHCAACELWTGLNAEIVKYLDSISIKQLAEKQEKLNQKNDEAPMFYI